MQTQINAAYSVRHSGAFGRFSGPLVVSILILWCMASLAAQGVGPPSVKGPMPETTENKSQENKAAKDLYKQTCARCHGADGSGKETRGDTKEIPDFTSDKWQEQRSNAQLLVSIREGKGTRMPAFASKLTDNQARDLLTFVRAFGSKQGKTTEKRRE